MLNSHRFDNLPDGLREILPLIVMVFGIAIPVALVIAAGHGGATIVLVLAVIAMVIVGGATMWFMDVITSEPSEQNQALGEHEQRPHA